MTTHPSVPVPHEVTSHGSVMRSDSTNSQTSVEADTPAFQMPVDRSKTP